MLSSFTSATRSREWECGLRDAQSSAQSDALRPTSKPDQSFRHEGTSSLWIERLTKIRQIRNIYSIRHEVETVHFLRNHPALIDLLLEAPAQIERYFGPSSLLVLE